MLLEMDSSELLYLLENDEALNAKVRRALLMPNAPTLIRPTFTLQIQEALDVLDAYSRGAVPAAPEVEA